MLCMLQGKQTECAFDYFPTERTETLLLHRTIWTTVSGLGNAFLGLGKVCRSQAVDLLGGWQQCLPIF